MISERLLAYADFIVNLSQTGLFEEYYCTDCLRSSGFSADFMPTVDDQSDTAFCEKCHRCRPTSNPYINAFIHQAAEPLLVPTDRMWHQSDYKVIYFDLNGRGRRSAAWLKARPAKSNYASVFQQNLAAELATSWPGGVAAPLISKAADAFTEQATFTESTLKRIYGKDLLPIAPAPDYLEDHPINPAVVDFSEFITELGRTNPEAGFYCETCQVSPLLIDARYLPFMDHDSPYCYWEDTGYCQLCHALAEVSHPLINQYIIDSQLDFNYPKRYEVNSDTFLMRDLFIGLSPLKAGVRNTTTVRRPLRDWFRGLTPPHVALVSNFLSGVMGL